MKLNTPNQQGVSRRGVLEGTIKQLRKAGVPEAELKRRFAELQPVTLHPNTEYLLQHFEELSATRAYGFSGPLPITYNEIKSYCDLFDVSFSPWEISSLKAMDNAYIEASYSMKQKA